MVKVAFLGSRPISLKALDIVVDYIYGPGKGLVDLSVFTKSDNQPPQGVIHWWNLGSLDGRVKKFHLKKISSEEELLSKGFDLVTMVFHNDIIPGNIVDVIPRGITNLHFGYLPSQDYSLKSGSPHSQGEPFSKGTYRGSNVLSHAILGKEKWQAVTFHFISERIDLGSVIEYAWNEITSTTTSWDLQLASEEKALAMFKKYFPILVEDPKSIKTLPPGKEKYPYFNRGSIADLKILPKSISKADLDLRARAFSFPNTEPPYFLEKELKKYVLYKKSKGVVIMEPRSEVFIQTLKDIT